MTELAVQSRADDGDALWAAFVSAPSQALRLRLFETYLPLARRIAGRIRKARPGADLDIDDLRQHGAEGLLQAIDRFDPARGIPFEAFAARRINGAILDGVAASSETRRQNAVRHRMRTERLRSLRPDPSDNLPPSDALAALADLAIELALGFLMEEVAVTAQGEAIAPGPSAYDSLAWSETVRRTRSALTALPDQEGAVVRLHYLEGLEFVRIAATLGLSKGRVSQIHASALQRLRKRLPRAEQLHIQR